MTEISLVRLLKQKQKNWNSKVCFVSNRSSVVLAENICKNDGNTSTDCDILFDSQMISYRNVIPLTVIS